MEPRHQFHMQSVLFVAAQSFALSACMLVAAVIPNGDSPGEAPFRYEFLVAVLIGTVLLKLITTEKSLVKTAVVFTITAAVAALVQHAALQMLPPDSQLHLIGFILMPALMGMSAACMLCLGSSYCVTLTQPNSERIALSTLLSAQIITMAGYSTLPFCNLYHVMQFLLGVSVCLKVAEYLVAHKQGILPVPLSQPAAGTDDAAGSHPARDAAGAGAQFQLAASGADTSQPEPATDAAGATTAQTPTLTWILKMWQALFGLGLIALIASLSWGTHVFISPDEQPLLKAYPWIYLGGLLACGLIYALGRKTWTDVQSSRHALLILASAGLLCAGLVNFIELPIGLVISMTITGMSALVIIFVLWVSTIQVAQAHRSRGWDEMRALVGFFVVVCFVGFVLPYFFGLAGARVIVPLAAACYFLVVGLSYEKQARMYRTALAAQKLDSAEATPHASHDDKTAPSPDCQIERVASKYKLSAREKEVLGLLAAGFTANYIADKLCISPYTAKTHIKNIYSKLEVHTKDELISCVMAEDELVDEQEC